MPLYPFNYPLKTGEYRGIPITRSAGHKWLAQKKINQTVYFFQKLGINMIMTVYISSLPVSM